jgi:hypothetical protein
MRVHHPDLTQDRHNQNLPAEMQTKGAASDFTLYVSSPPWRSCPVRELAIGSMPMWDRAVLCMIRRDTVHGKRAQLNIRLRTASGV